MALPNWYRRCVGCWSGKDKREMLRIVKFKDAEPEIDWQQKKPGRGAYICLNVDCVRLAKKKRALEKAFHCSIDAELYEKIMKQVEQVEKGEN